MTIKETICWSEEHRGDWVVFPCLLLETILLISDCCNCKYKLALLNLKCFMNLPALLWTSLLNSKHGLTLVGTCCTVVVGAGLLILSVLLAQLIGSKGVACDNFEIGSR